MTCKQNSPNIIRYVCYHFRKKWRDKWWVCTMSYSGRWTMPSLHIQFSTNSLKDGFLIMWCTSAYFMTVHIRSKFYWSLLAQPFRLDSSFEYPVIIHLLSHSRPFHLPQHYHPTPPSPSPSLSPFFHSHFLSTSQWPV